MNITIGDTNPFNLTFGLIEKSMKMGAVVQTGSRVDKVVIESGKVRGVRTKDENYSAEKVVLATSAWTRELVQELGVIPLRSHAALTETIPVMPAPAFEVVVDGEIIYGSTQFRNGHILLGGGPDRPRTMVEQYDYTMSWKDTLKNASILATNTCYLFWSLIRGAEYVSVINCKATHPKQPLHYPGTLIAVNGSQFSIPDRQFSRMRELRKAEQSATYRWTCGALASW